MNLYFFTSILNKIKYNLKNETGSPIIEHIFIMGISLMCTYGLIKLWDAFNSIIPSFLTYISKC